MARIVFYVRNRPQSCDAMEIAKLAKMAFIGYPLWRENASNFESDLATSIISPATDEENWTREHSRPRTPHKTPKSTNRNLVRDAQRGSIVVCPRPAEGVVFVGRTLEFVVESNPSWGTEYIKLRQRAGLDTDPENRHWGDVAQGWRVDEWKPIPLVHIPAWMRYSLFGRGLRARIRPWPSMGFEPWNTLDGLLRGQVPAQLEPTSDIAEIKRRIWTFISPESFEHLTVAILQIQNPEMQWIQTGGSGDGGIDGLGFDVNGRATGFLQCKATYSGAKLVFDAQNESSYGPDSRRIIASLYSTSDIAVADDVEHLTLDWVARAMREHAASLPWARTMRIVDLG
ncbi:restriction endonuclease [Hyphomonas sp.]|uniref:restriction endonuclease n=1 Tax=Hyphomonas sp. TaxID=87 RepID=UPI0030F4C910